MCEHCKGHDTADVSFVLRNEAGKSTEINFSYEELAQFAKQIDEMSHKGHEDFQKMTAFAYLSNKEVQQAEIRTALIDAKFAAYREAVLEAVENCTDLEHFRQELKTIENTNELVEKLSPSLARRMED